MTTPDLLRRRLVAGAALGLMASPALLRAAAFAPEVPPDDLAPATPAADAAPAAPVAVRDEPDTEASAADTLAADKGVVAGDWAAFPYPQAAYTYTFAELEQQWDSLLRGYMIPFPSPEYLRQRYARYPQLWKELRFPDENWAMHSRNTLEVWLLFFRGDFKAAWEAGNSYGGFSRVPALFAQIIQAIYLAPTLREKHALLQDAVEGITYYSSVFRPQPKDDPAYRADYVVIRLGYAYAVGRVAEDVSIPRALAQDYIGKVTQASNDILLAYPEHPMGLGLSAGISANIIRRAGKLAGNIAFGATADDARTRFETSFALVPDVALTRYEYANTLLYVDNTAAIDEAIAQLEMAAAFKPRHAIEALDIAYAHKRLLEVRDYRASGGGFPRYDRKRRRFQNRTGQNLYCVTGTPFLTSQA
jgi:hypothetical protein